MRLIVASTLVLFLVSGFACWHLSFRLPGDADPGTQFWAMFGFSLIGIGAASSIVLITISEGKRHETIENFIGMLIVCLISGGLICYLISINPYVTRPAWALYIILNVSYVIGFLIVLVANTVRRRFGSKAKLASIGSLNEQRNAG